MAVCFVSITIKYLLLFSQLLTFQNYNYVEHYLKPPSKFPKTLLLNRWQLLVDGDAEPSDVRLVVVLHRHAAGQPARTGRSVRRAARAGREGPVAVDAGHGHRREQALTLAEQQDRLGHLGGSIGQHIPSPFHLQQGNLFLVQVLVQLLDHARVRTHHAGDHQQVDLAVLQRELLAIHKCFDVLLQIFVVQ